MREFLDGLSRDARAKVYAALARLEERGNRLLMPRTRSLGGGLHESRITHPEGPFRVIYCFLSGRRVILLHGFVKRTEQTPAIDLDMARGRKREIR